MLYPGMYTSLMPGKMWSKCCHGQKKPLSSSEYDRKEHIEDCVRGQLWHSQSYREGAGDICTSGDIGQVKEAAKLLPLSGWETWDLREHFSASGQCSTDILTDKSLVQLSTKKIPPVTDGNRCRDNPSQTLGRALGIMWKRGKKDWRSQKRHRNHIIN